MAGFTPSETILAAGRITVGSLFSTRAALNPDHKALIDGERSLTYRELDRRTDRLAAAFAAQGLRRGDRVAILSRNCLEYLEVTLAAAKSGLIVAALNWRLGDRELAHCINLVEPELIISQEEFAPALQRLDISVPRHWTLGAEYQARIDASPDTPPPPCTDPEAGLIILYTSGTTGLPKGALISHRAMIARGLILAGDLKVPFGDNFIAWAPLYHMASTDQSLGCLMRSGTVHIVDGFLPDQLIDIIEAVPMRLFVLMPGTVGPFADAFVARRARAKGVGMCGAMADLVPREHIAAASRCLDAPYYNSFGSTETGLPPASNNVIPIGVAPTSLPKRQNSICEIRLVDPDDNEVPDGSPGEVAFRGPTLFSGYWNADATNAKDFRNGWFHMGDVMRRNPDGTLDYVDRVKFMIKSGGENIYPAEIEQVLLGDPRVTEAVVVRQADAKWGEVPVAFVVRNDPALTAEALQGRCERDLSGFKRPKAIIFIDNADLPRSTTGKVQRHALESRLKT
ncbi:MAG: AMP-binding protein [Rhodobacteraceae bacterium]|nr:AMP-binding protein [Paracoccaceae bacterium]